MTSSKKQHRVKLCGNCAWAWYQRRRSQTVIMRCTFSRAVKVADLCACELHKWRDVLRG